MNVLEEQLEYWKNLVKITNEDSEIYTWIKDNKIEQKILSLANLIQENKELNKNYSNLITCITNIAKILQDSIEDGSESLNLIENEIYNTGIFDLN